MKDLPKSQRSAGRIGGIAGRLCVAFAGSLVVTNVTSVAVAAAAVQKRLVRFKRLERHELAARQTVARRTAARRTAAHRTAARRRRRGVFPTSGNRNERDFTRVRRTHGVNAWLGCTTAV